MSTNSPLKAVRYMTRFRCIAERCEDTCCARFHIPMTERDLRNMSQVVDDPEVMGWIVQRVDRPPDAPPGSGGTIRLKGDSDCTFLNEKRLCALQVLYDEPVLPRVCSMFPRMEVPAAGGALVVGSLRCPEAVRLALLAEDAMEVEQAPEGLLPRPLELDAPQVPPGKEVEAALTEPFRELALQLLERSELTLASWLAALGQVAHMVEAFCEQGPTLEQARAMMDAVCQQVLQTGQLTSMHGSFSALEMPAWYTLEICADMLERRAQGLASYERFAAPVRGALESLELGRKPLEEVWKARAARWAWLESHHGARVRQYLRHYAINHLRSMALDVAVGLGGHVLRLAQRMALVHLVLGGHPRVTALYEGGQALSPEQAREELDVAAVESVQLLTKYLLYTPEFLQFTASLMENGRDKTLQRTFMLAKLVAAGGGAPPAARAAG